MKKIAVLLSFVFFTLAGQAQKLYEIARPIPAAISAEAPMPAAMAKKYERVKIDRNNKYATLKQPAKVAVSSTVTKKMNQYITKGTDAYQIKYNTSDEYRIYHPNLKIMNTSHGREPVKGSGEKFNPKKDRMSNAVLRNGNEICIVNRNDKLVEMGAFLFTTTSEAIRIEKNKILLNVPVTSIAQGQYPMLHKVKCIHLISQTEYTFDIQMYWAKQINLSGQTGAYALTTVNSPVYDNLGMLCDLDSKMLAIVELPFTIEADGHNGADGKKGHYGANGTDQYSYKDSDGNTKTVAGTCAKAGQDGQDGENGTDGGQFLFCISPELVEAYGMDGLIATVDAGIGGKGGKGGEGGIHGKGSGCSGKAPDGKNGKNGRDGKQGDFLYVLSDVYGFYSQIFK